MTVRPWPARHGEGEKFSSVLQAQPSFHSVVWRQGPGHTAITEGLRDQGMGEGEGEWPGGRTRPGHANHKSLLQARSLRRVVCEHGRGLHDSQLSGPGEVRQPLRASVSSLKEESTTYLWGLFVAWAAITGATERAAPKSREELTKGSGGQECAGPHPLGRPRGGSSRPLPAAPVSRGPSSLALCPHEGTSHVGSGATSP